MLRPLHYHRNSLTHYCRTIFLFALVLFFSQAARATCNAAWTYTTHGDTVFLSSADTFSTNSHYWTFSGGSGGANATHVTHVFPNNGTYTICLYVYTPGGSCIDSLCQSVTVQAGIQCHLNTNWTYTTHGDTVFTTCSDTNSANHHYWTFGSYTSTSNSLTATYVFPQPGTYRVCLHEYTPNTNCVDSFCQYISVTSGTPCNLNTSWTYTTHGDTVYVTAADTNSANHHYWTFDGYTSTSNSLTATYVFPQSGAHHVCLHEYTPGTNCVDSSCQTVTVTAATCTLNALWQSYAHGDTVFFFAGNVNTAAHYFWNFGDGSPVVSGTQPVHVYANAGTYHVCLYAYIPNTTCTDSFCNNVTVTVTTCHLNMAWTYTVHGDSVYVTAADTSTANHHYWTASNNSSVIVGTSGVFVFPNYGTYRICLHEYLPGSTCIDSSCNTVTIAAHCSVSAAWIYSSSPVNRIQFYGIDTNPAAVRSWSFGDGTYNNLNVINPLKVYSAPGTYHVCLRIYIPGANCVDSFCSSITVGTPCNLNAGWQATTHGDTAHFYAATNNTGTAYTWNFGDGHTGTGTNPTHVYTQPGAYHVCLVVYSSSTCRDSFCNTVTIAGGCHVSAAWTYTTHGDTVFLHSADTSSANNHYWTFGTPNYTSGTNITHVVTGPGTYHICLHVYTPGTTCSDSSCNNVTIINPCNVHAAWQSYAVHDSVHFYNFNNDSTVHLDWNFGDGTYGFGTNPWHGYAAAGTYHVCCYAYTNGCIDSFCNTVTVGSGCHVNAAWTYTIHGDTVFLHSTDTSSANNHYWTFGTPNYTSGTNVTHVFTGPGSYHICLHVYTPGTACSDSSCNTITITNPCTVNAAWQSYTVGDTAHFFAAGNIGGTIYYSWHFGDGTSGTGQNPTHVYAQAGTYHVCLYAYSGTNCLDSFCNTITVGNGCHVSAAWTYTIHGDTVFLHSADTSSANNHYWTIGPAIYASGTNVTHVFTGPGTYHICLHVYTPGTACVDSSCNTVTISTTCNVTAAWQSYSVGDTAHFFAAGNTSGVTYNWNFGDGHTGTGANPLHTYAQPGTYHVCLLAYTGTNCIDSFCNTITVGSGCHVSAAWTYTIHGDTVYLQSSDTSSANHHYWLFNGNTSNYSSGTSVTHVFPGPGTYHICLYVYTPGTTCSDSSCNNITIINTCTANAAWISHDHGDTVFFAAADTNSATYLDWNFGDGSYGFGQYPTHVYTQPGTYHVCLYAYTSNTCVDSFCNTITVSSGCHVSAAWSYTVQGDTVYLHSSDTSSANHHYWTFGTPNYTVGTNITHVFNGPGTYHICLYVYTPGTNCADSSCNTITITNPCNVNAAWQSYGHGDTMHFFAGGNTGNVYYNWNFGDGHTGTGSTPTHVYAGPGTYHVCLYAYTGTNCIDSFCNTITVGSGCHLNTTWNYTIFGDTFYFQNPDTNTVAHHFWNFGDGSPVASGTTVSHHYSAPGVYHVCYYVYIPGSSCVDSACNDITINSPCSLSAALNFVNVSHDTVAFYALFADSAANYVWIYGDGTTSTGAYSVHGYPVPGTYNVCLHVFIPGTPCADTFCVQINVGASCAVTAEWASITRINDSIQFYALDPDTNAVHNWNFGDGSTSSGSYAAHSYANAGTYHVCLYVYIPGTTCSDSICKDVSSVLGIGEMGGNYPAISLRPNPFSQYTIMNIDGPAATYEVRIYDVIGQQVRTVIGVNNSIMIDRGNLSSGMYMYAVMAGNTVIGKGKMTIE